MVARHIHIDLIISPVNDDLNLDNDKVLTEVMDALFAIYGEKNLSIGGSSAGLTDSQMDEDLDDTEILP